MVVTRAFKGQTAQHYTFDPKSSSSIPVVSASGEGPNFSYHGPDTRGGGTLQLVAADSPSCVCNSGIKGTINGVPFEKICRPEPFGDLVLQKNPTCLIQTYQGGLMCGHHKYVLLDADQEQPSDLFTYHLKFRFYFQLYTPPPTTVDNGILTNPSHQNLIRLYYQTEAYAGEYDILKAPPSTPPGATVHVITARFQVSTPL